MHIGTYQCMYHGTYQIINNKKYMDNKEFVRKLTKTGRESMYVIIPKGYIKSLGWKEKQKLVVERVTGGVLVKDWRKR